MKIFLLLFCILFVCLLAYWIVVFFQRVSISKTLIANARTFQIESADHTTTLLILGDSTGVGVGASRPEDSVAGRLAEEMGATYAENAAVSGAKVRDISAQIERAKLSRYSVILLQVGANDIIQFGSVPSVALELDKVLKRLQLIGDAVYLMMAGDVGRTQLFPPFIRPFHHLLTMQYHKAFAEAAQRYNVTYINLYEPKEHDPFAADPNRYHARDGLHPSSEGYELWFRKLQTALLHIPQSQ